MLSSDVIAGCVTCSVDGCVVGGKSPSSSNLVVSASSRPFDFRNSIFFSVLEFLTVSSCRNLLA